MTCGIGPKTSVERHDEAVAMCEKLAERDPARRAEIFEAFFGPQPKVKRGKRRHKPRRP